MQKIKKCRRQVFGKAHERKKRSHVKVCLWKHKGTLTAAQRQADRGACGGKAGEFASHCYHLLSEMFVKCIS